MDHGRIPADSVDRLIADWSRVRPELDFAPVSIVARLARARTYIDGALEAVFEGSRCSSLWPASIGPPECRSAP